MQLSRRLIVALLTLCFVASVTGMIPLNQTPVPLPTPEGDYTVYSIQTGDTLGGIAARFGTTVHALARANRIIDINMIRIGQQLYIPQGHQPHPEDTATEANAVAPTPTPSEVSAEGTATETSESQTGATTPNEPTAEFISTALPASTDLNAQAAPTNTLEPPIETPLPPTATDTPEPTTTPTEVVPPPPMEFGIELYTNPQQTVSDAGTLSALGAQWAKLHVQWRDLEKIPGIVDYANLDTEIAALQGRGLHILLTVSTAPNWARSAQEENGPPDDFSVFADFLSELAQHYAGRVAAYEIWNEPNLRREWHSDIHPLGAQSYAQMLQPAYTAIKNADPSAQVISAGLAPTGIDDGLNAVNDRRFFTELLATGLAQYADGFGVHPYGFGNPPDMPCCDAPDGVQSHYGDVSFYFRSMLETYRDLAAAYVSIPPLWVTDFGWGISDPGVEIPRNFAYIAYNTPEEQAAFTLSAIDVAKDFGIVRVIILSNLNGCSDEAPVTETCYLSVNAANNLQRPVFQALRERALNPAPTVERIEYIGQTTAQRISRRRIIEGKADG